MMLALNLEIRYSEGFIFVAFLYRSDFTSCYLCYSCLIIAYVIFYSLNSNISQSPNKQIYVKIIVNLSLA